MADTTTAASWPASTSRFTRAATAWMRSTSASEVPPNFITMRVLPAALVIGQGPRNRADAAEPRPLPGDRQVSILNSGGAKQGPAARIGQTGSTEQASNP